MAAGGVFSKIDNEDFPVRSLMNNNSFGESFINQQSDAILFGHLTGFFIYLITCCYQDQLDILKFSVHV